MMSRRPFGRTRRYVYELLKSPRTAFGGKVVSSMIALVIVISVTGTVLESVPDLRAAYDAEFQAIEIVCLTLFSIEYGLRVWTAPEHIPYRQLSAFAARRAFMTSPLGIVDFLAIAPLWVAILGVADLRILIVLRVLRILKFIRYSSGMNSLLDVLWSERRALGGCVIILICATLMSASAMYVLEGKIQPEKFGTIPEAMWWSLVTLSTIGYGDAVPVTVGGRLVAAVTIVGGLIMIALPVGIVATAFAEVIHRRDFIVTLNMVARVPAFSHLTANDIAHVMRLLRAYQAERGEIIVHREEPAHSVYFISEGEVEIELGKGRKVRLGPGQFFGERALLRQTKRSATVTAVSRVQLLVLDAADWNSLLAREPGIAEHIHRIAATRMDEAGAPAGAPNHSSHAPREDIG